MKRVIKLFVLMALVAVSVDAKVPEAKKLCDAEVKKEKPNKQALKDKSVDKNHDNVVTILELSKKLKESNYNTDYQYPVIRNVGNDIQLEKIQTKGSK